MMVSDLLRRELQIAWVQAGDSVAAVAFLVLAGTLFPLALGPSPEALARIAPGVVWVCALLAALLPLERVVGADLDDGSLDLLLLSGQSAAAVAATKAAGHFVGTGLPVLAAAVPLAAMLSLPAGAWGALIGGLALGTAVLSLVGVVGSSLVAGARRGGVLLPLLTLPLMAPVVVFGAAAADLAGAGLSPRVPLLLLAALLAAAVPLCPIAAGAALRAAAG